MNEIRLWILNDEGLYNWQRSSKLSMSHFIREYRTELERAIERTRDRVTPKP